MASRIHRYVTIIAVVFWSICRGSVAQEHNADYSNMCIESICIPGHQAENERIAREFDACLREAATDQGIRICHLNYEANSLEASIAFSDCWVDCRRVPEDRPKKAIGLKTNFL